MTERSEALAQLARLVGDDSLRSASPEEARVILNRELYRLVESLVDEAAQSDDVFDRDSGLAYFEHRLQALAGLIDNELRDEMSVIARERIENW